MLYLRFLVALFSLCLVSQNVRAQGSSGAFSTSIPIEVPSFRGFQPNLSLSYNSSRGNGVVGVGWAFTGFGAIERIGGGGGAPGYDAMDGYVLGGQRLRICGASLSPGCLSGGTHFSEHESYERVVFDSSADRWTVTEPDGSTRTYAPIFIVEGQTFRWGMTFREDTLGNAVSYGWWCDGDKNCYPDDVRYNGYRVKLFYRGDRSDGVSFATGASIGETRQLLTSIKVELEGGTPIRAYDLSYASVGSRSTGRSLLESVRIYGTDVVIDDLTGEISGGTSLPADGFAYLEDAAGHSLTDGSSWGQACSGYWGSGDFNGDGRQDYYCHFEIWGGELDVGISDGSTFTVASWGAGICNLPNDWMSTGDFNGDGKTDFMCKPDRGGAKVGLSDGTGLVWSEWIGQGYCRGDLGDRIIQGDFNGDGKTDISCFDGPEGKWTVRTSEGARFGSSSVWLRGWCRSDKVRSHGVAWGDDAKIVLPGDFDGDGDTDLMCDGYWSFGGVWVAKSNAESAFVHDGSWTDAFPHCLSHDQLGLGDFNGDGKTDLSCYDNKYGGRNWKTWVGLSDGSDFHVSEWLGTQKCDKLSAADMNGDGSTDIWCHTEGDDTHVGLSDGFSGFDDMSSWKTDWCSTAFMAASDFNGDGKSDLFCLDPAGQVAISGSVVGKTDLLNVVRSSMGALTTLAYLPGTAWSNTSVAPLGLLTRGDPSGNTSTSASSHRRFPALPTVTSVTVDDGRGWSKTTTYTYKDGVYDSVEGRWMGFGYSKSTEPSLPGEAAGPYVETWYRQDVAAAGVVDFTERRDGSGNLLAATDPLFETGGDGVSEPWFARIIGQYSYLYDGSTQAPCGTWPCAYGERRAQEIGYDAFGNRTGSRDYGNVDAANDEVTTVWEIYPETGSYVTNLPARVVSYAGIGTGGNVLTDSLYFYDGASAHDQPPIRGMPTNQSNWLNTESRYIPLCASGNCIEYDAFGNPIKVTDIKNGSTVIAYESSFNLFPEVLRNPLGHEIRTVWDPVCQAPSAMTDQNGQSTTTSYDALCRHERTEGATGAFTETSYVAIGNSQSQYLETRSPSPSTSGVHWTRSYFDGLGRRYEDRRRGTSSGDDIITGEHTFDARGNVASTSKPRLESESAHRTHFAYDARNRPTLTTYPDQATESSVYGINFTLRYNAESDGIAASRDGTGLVTYRTEYLGTTPIVTTTIQDIEDRSQTIIDAMGNSWLTKSDSLGRIMFMSDPDSGIETKEYNDANELTAIVNGANERSEFTYDLLGRMLTKTTLAGSPQEETTTFLYDEPRDGYFNVGALTSMFDAAGARKHDYDALGRQARAERSVGETSYVFTHAYNVAGLVASTTYPDGQSISWAYDAAGGLQTETGTLASATYDASGRPTSRVFANGVVTYYRYSPTRGWLDEIETVSGSTIVQDMRYTRFADGMVRSVTSARPSESWNYSYDSLNRLTSATNAGAPGLSQSFTYDAIGNMTFNSAIGAYLYAAPGAGQPHAVQVAGERAYDYDAAGRMTSRNGTLIQWNGDEKPASIGNVGFTYGGTGERLEKVAGGRTTTYIGGDYEIADDGTVTKYLHGGKQVGSSFFVHHTDRIGSIRGVTDANGAEVRWQEHTPFGRQHSVSGIHQESKGFIGEREEETGLVYLNARYYDPELSRFASPDPFAQPGQGLNRYTYAYNNPINFSDASGLSPDPIVFDNGCVGSEMSQAVGNVSVTDDGHGHQSISGVSWSTRYVPSAGCKFTSGTNFSGYFTWQEMMVMGSDGGAERLDLKLEDQQFFASNSGPTAGAGPGPSAGPGPGTGAGSGKGSGPGTVTLTYCQKHPERCGGGGATGTGVLDGVQASLDAISLGLDATGVGGAVSWVPDLLNAAVSLSRGDIAGAGLSTLAAVPFVGAPANALRLGRQGEKIVKLVKNNKRIPSMTGTAAYRIPDALHNTQRFIGEIKNVRRLSFTRQLRDYVLYAQTRGYRFDLMVRQGTKLSQPLQSAIDAKKIILRRPLP